MLYLLPPKNWGSTLHSMLIKSLWKFQAAIFIDLLRGLLPVSYLRWRPVKIQRGSISSSPPEVKERQQTHAVSHSFIKFFFCSHAYLCSPRGQDLQPASTHTSCWMPHWTTPFSCPLALPLPHFSRLQTAVSLPSTLGPYILILSLPWILLQEF